MFSVTDAGKATGLMTRTPVAWSSAIVVAAAIGWAESKFMELRSSFWVILLLIAGAGFIALAHYTRRRWGGGALGATCLSTILVCTLLLPRAFLYELVRWIDTNDISFGKVFVLSTCTFGLVPVAIFLQRSARRSRPLLEWDLPIGLIVFTLGQLVGFALPLAYLILTTPPIG